MVGSVCTAGQKQREEVEARPLYGKRESDCCILCLDRVGPMNNQPQTYIIPTLNTAVFDSDPKMPNKCGLFYSILNSWEGGIVIN